jgi:O-acetyl-ADP-ribose deacetylase (regulator of RNase III)
VHSIAFPAISCGVYGFPIPRASEIAYREVSAVLDTSTVIRKVIFACFNDDVYHALDRQLRMAGE